LLTQSSVYPIWNALWRFVTQICAPFSHQGNRDMSETAAPELRHNHVLSAALAAIALIPTEAQKAIATTAKLSDTPEGQLLTHAVNGMLISAGFPPATVLAAETAVQAALKLAAAL
jgi:hypothetical protein